MSVLTWNLSASLDYYCTHESLISAYPFIRTEYKAEKLPRAIYFVNLTNMSKEMWTLVQSAMDVTLQSDFLIVAADSQVREVSSGREDYA
jgi:hypothetical protein